MTKPKVVYAFVVDEVSEVIDIWAKVECGNEFYIGEIVEINGPCPLLRLDGALGVNAVKHIITELEKEKMLKKIVWEE